MNNSSGKSICGSDDSATTAGFSHVDHQGKPVMVDVTEKSVTKRSATAQTRVIFPEAVFKALREQGHHAKKGPIIDTAIIAGVMGAKRTSDLIPFCHPLPLDGCDLNIVEDAGNCSLVITATAKVTHKTGVEMEALMAVSIAALTLYDMCKALSHEIVINDTRLIKKTGGKSDIKY